MKYLIILSLLLIMVNAQRPSYASSGPIGRPGLASRFKEDNPSSSTTIGTVTFENRVGEDGSTPKIPVDAKGDVDLVNTLNSWDREHQPFWFINADHIEKARNTTRPPQVTGQNQNSQNTQINNRNQIDVQGNQGSISGIQESLQGNRSTRPSNQGANRGNLSGNQNSFRENQNISSGNQGGNRGSFPGNQDSYQENAEISQGDRRGNQGSSTVNGDSFQGNQGTSQGNEGDYRGSFQGNQSSNQGRFPVNQNGIASNSGNVRPISHPNGSTNGEWPQGGIHSTEGIPQRFPYGNEYVGDHRHHEGAPLRPTRYHNHRKNLFAFH